VLIAIAAVAALACATTTPAAPGAPAAGDETAAAAAAAAVAPAPVVARQEQLCQEQPAATRAQFEEVLAKVNADLKASGKKIKLGVAQVDNTECSLASNQGRYVVDIIQNMSLSIESAGKAPALGNAALSFCHALTAAADGSGYAAGPCENGEALERFNDESVQTAINDELYKLEKLRIEIE
jgi:hypothetical protein